jgi:hypothetical protein
MMVAELVVWLMAWEIINMEPLAEAVLVDIVAMVALVALQDHVLPLGVKPLAVPLAPVEPAEVEEPLLDTNVLMDH